MTPAAFRRLALSMPDAVEGSHMGHPDFRIRGKIFATLFRRGDDEHCMFKLTPEQQRTMVKENPGVFEPCSGAWGRHGATQALVRDIDRDLARRAVTIAWRNTAPRRLVDEHDDSGG